MAARRKVGKGKARKRSTPRSKQSRPLPAAVKSRLPALDGREGPFEQTRSSVKSPPSGQKSTGSAPLAKAVPWHEIADVAAANQADSAPVAEKAREILDKLQQAAADRLTTRRRRFIEEYLISGNGTQAAILAGFSVNRADVEASELLKDPIVGAEVARRKAELNAKLQITQERVLTEKAAIAFSDLGEILGEEEDGTPIIRPLSEWSPTARKAVKSVKVKRFTPKPGEKQQAYQILEFELWSKPAAVDRLEARLDSEASANRGVDLANLTDKERLRIIAEVLSRGRAARDAVMKGKKKTA